MCKLTAFATFEAVRDRERWEKENKVIQLLEAASRTHQLLPLIHVDICIEGVKDIFTDYYV